MKKLLFVLFSLIIFLLVVLTLNHAAGTLDRVGNNVYASFVKDCDPGTVSLTTSTLLGLTDKVEVAGWNCAGPDNGGQRYVARIQNHFFWLL